MLHTLGSPERSQPVRVPLDRETRDRQDRALIHRYVQTGDPRLREEVIERFMPLARALAHRYQTGAEPLEDLIQAASEGLVKAVDGFDLSRDVSFSSYATPVILGTLRHHFRDGTQSVHLPRSLQERIHRVGKIIDDLCTETGRTPDVPSIALRCNLTRVEVEEALVAEAARSTLSINRPAHGVAGQDSPAVWETLGGTDFGYDRVEASAAGQDADLDHREWRTLELRFEEGLTQREIAAEIGVSQMQVSRLLSRSLAKLLNAVRGHPPEGAGPTVHPPLTAHRAA